MLQSQQHGGAAPSPCSAAAQAPQRHHPLVCRPPSLTRSLRRCLFIDGGPGPSSRRPACASRRQLRDGRRSREHGHVVAVSGGAATASLSSVDQGDSIAGDSSHPAIPKHWQQEMRQGSWGRQRGLERYVAQVLRINALEPSMRVLSDQQLQAKTDEFRARLANGASVDDLLPEAFAAVREAARRVLGMRHYDCQLVGGMVLHEGQIAEMATGEGKTLVATLPVYLNALTGKGVHVITVNDYLAARDAEWMGKVYRFLGLTVAAVQSGTESQEAQAAFRCDITYVTGQELCFTYLRDNTAMLPSELRLRDQLHYAVVDEVDSILIDESRNPMIISSPLYENSELVATVDKAVRRLWEEIQASIGRKLEASPFINPQAAAEGAKKKYMFIDNKVKNLSLNEEGMSFVLNELMAQGVEFVNANQEGRPPNIMDLWEDPVPWGQMAVTALKAYQFYEAGVQYIVRDDQVLIIDESTGRVRPMTRYQHGIHQAIEAKEGVPIHQESHATATITFQVFFRFYSKLCGMTGTARAAEAEFYEIYKLQVTTIPTNRPMVRDDMQPRLYFTEKDKLAHLAAWVQRCWDLDRPVLIGTTSVNESERVKAALNQWASTRYRQKQRHIQLLNAKPENVRTEAQIIAQAGLPSSVTIATNMAGRGTDIILGGNPEGLTHLALMRLIYRRLISDPLDSNAIPPMPLEAFDPYDTPNCGDISSQVQEHAAQGHSLPWPLHQSLIGPILMTQIPTSYGIAAGQEASFRYEQARSMASHAVELAEKLRREVRRRLRALYTNDKLEELQYDICVAPLAEDVYVDMEGMVLDACTSNNISSSSTSDRGSRDGKGSGLEVMAQPFAVKAALLLWLWLDQQCARFAERVRDAGGLLVVGVSLQESKRIELQLRGRAGRQGDPGQSMLLFDLMDPLMQMHGLSFMQEVFNQMQLAETGVHFLDGLIVSKVKDMVQRAVENQWQMGRLETRQIDEIMEKYRHHLYSLRRLILTGTSQQRKQIIYMFLQQWVDALVGRLLDSKAGPKAWAAAALSKPAAAGSSAIGGRSSSRNSSAPSNSGSTSSTSTAVLSQQPQQQQQMSPWQMLLSELEQLLNPPGQVGPSLEFLTLTNSGAGKDVTQQALSARFGAAAASRVNLEPVQLLSEQQRAQLEAYLLHGKPLQWRQQQGQPRMTQLLALARHQQLFGTVPGRAGRGKGAAVTPQRPALTGRHAERVSVLRDYLGEVLIQAYQQRHSQLISSMCRRSVAAGGGTLDLDAEWHVEVYEKRIMLEWVDVLWSCFLEDTEKLRRAVGLKAYANSQPMEEFRLEANAAFANMLDAYRDAVVQHALLPDIYLHPESYTEPPQPSAPAAIDTTARPVQEEQAAGQQQQKQQQEPALQQQQQERQQQHAPGSQRPARERAAATGAAGAKASPSGVAQQPAQQHPLMGVLKRSQSWDDEQQQQQLEQEEVLEGGRITSTSSVTWQDQGAADADVHGMLARASSSNGTGTARAQHWQDQGDAQQQLALQQQQQQQQQQRQHGAGGSGDTVTMDELSDEVIALPWVPVAPVDMDSSGGHEQQYSIRRMQPSSSDVSMPQTSNGVMQPSSNGVSMPQSTNGVMQPSSNGGSTPQTSNGSMEQSSNGIVQPSSSSVMQPDSNGAMQPSNNGSASQSSNGAMQQEQQSQFEGCVNHSGDTPASLNGHGGSRNGASSHSMDGLSENGTGDNAEGQARTPLQEAASLN